MPVVFTCEHCQGCITLSSRHAGRRLLCPHCQQPILVPSAQSSTAAILEPPPPISAPPLAATPEHLTPPPAPASAVPDDDRDVVVVTRTVVLMQGSLLLLLALIGFVSGYFVARSYGPASAHVPQPSFITGILRYQRGNNRPAADDGAVVLLLPAKEVPDRMSRLSVFGLRPQDTQAGPSGTNSDALRAMGGDLCRATGEGFYHLRVRDSGEYYVLFLSAHLQRADDEPLNRQMLAELGRYVDRANELIGGNAFVWKRMTIDHDVEMNEVLK
jgi:hypothetical protein